MLSSVVLFLDASRMAQGLMKLKRVSDHILADDRKGEISQHYHSLS